MKVCGMRVPLPFLPALSMKLAIDSVQLPISGTFQPSFSMPLAICASSGPMP
jgi:hypothetical protein